MEIKFTVYDKDKEYFIPIRATNGSSGYDLFSADETYELQPGEIKLFDTNIALEIPYGIEGQVRSRSGMALKKGVMVLNSPGTIDSDYRGSVGVILINLGKEPVLISRWDRIAQLVFCEVCIIDLKFKNLIRHSDRGSNGFGSSGMTGLK